MTNKERFAKVVAGDPSVDYCPAIEWASWWDKTLACWEKEGLPKGMSSSGLYDRFGLDRNIQFWLRPKTEDCPKPKSDGAALISDLDEYLEYKKYLYPKDALARFEKEIEEAIPQAKDGSALIWYTLEGFFWFPRTLFGIEGHLYAFYDEPDLYHRICEDLLAWHLEMVSQLSKIIPTDFMTIAEDMSYNLGPMLSEEHFEEFLLPYYKSLCPAIKAHGTRVIVDSDGDISRAVPWFQKAGIEGILPLERQAGVDINALQKEYPEFIWLGGFDKMCMLKDPAAIDAEIERITPAVRRGRYIPSMDHQTPPGVTMANYRHYVKRLREVCGEACRDAR